MNPIQEREEGEEQVEEQEAGEGEDHLHNFRQQWKQELQQGAAGATDQNLEKEKDDAKQEEDLEDEVHKQVSKKISKHCKEDFLLIYSLAHIFSALKWAPECLLQLRDMTLRNA